MQFSSFLVATAAFAVAQAVQFDNPSFAVTAGQPFNLTWSAASGPVTILLKDGPSTALVTVSTVASGLTGTSYVWDVPASLPSNTYAFQIEDSTNVPNYSVPFQLIGGAAASSSSSAASSTSTGSSSSSSASSSAASTVTSTSSSSASASSSSATTTGSNSTTSSASKTSSSASTTTGSKTSSATTAAATTDAPGSAAGLSSPLAFVFLALAAFFTLN